MNIHNIELSVWIAGVSALLALLSLGVSCYSSKATKKYALEQIELATKQFVAEKMPDVEIKVFCQRKHPGTQNMDMGLFVEAINHSPNITVNEIKVFLIVEELSDCKGIGFIFPTFSDLKPNQTMKIEALQDFETAIPKIFTESSIEKGSFIIDDASSSFSRMKDYDSYPASLSMEYLPRFVGAETVKKEREMYLFVKHETPNQKIQRTV